MKLVSPLVFFCCIVLNACAQAPAGESTTRSKNNVGGPCEGCEAIFESPVPFDQLKNVDTLPDFNDGTGPRLEISGIVYQRDGKTPAKDAVIYVYHTDQKGVYPTKGNEKGWAKRHGYIRGWVKTDANGHYKLYTQLPASYPNSKAPKHIHPIVKEKDKNPYWIDEYLFEGDPYLENEGTTRPPRGGNGIIKTVMKDGMLRATRHIILGMNVPDYPQAAAGKIMSGLSIGANCPAFDPLHLSGADKGSTACPMCKYGYGKGVMVWINHANLDQMSGFLQTMEKEINTRGEKNMRVFVIYMNPFYKENDAEETKIVQRKIAQWCADQSLNKVALVWVPSPVDEETSALFKINPEAKNTVMVYKKRKVASKWVNMEYDESASRAILSAIQ